jgi:acyl-coenzyme A thioesterase PaaI-like protein
MERLGRQDRQRLLELELRQNPFLTDEQLADRFGVSVPTIRLDRLSLGIPELRQRTQGLARKAMEELRALGSQELVGELVELELGRRATSTLTTDATMAFARNGVVRGHYIFAQADSLAIAVIDGEVVLTGLVNAKFKRPVMAGEVLVARAEVLRRGKDRAVVLVVTTVRHDVVFRAKFVEFVLAPAGGAGRWGAGRNG